MLQRHMRDVPEIEKSTSLFRPKLYLNLGIVGSVATSIACLGAIEGVDDGKASAYMWGIR